MGLFTRELANVVEWNDERKDVLFWKWPNDEIKKGSKLIIRPGQDAIFLKSGRIEGIFTDEGSYDIESEIIPFLSTLGSFKFGFNAPLRAEVLFVNTKEMLVKWGTKNAINLQAPGLPGGMPIRSFGTCSCKVGDFDVLIDKLAGVKSIYTVNDVKERIVAELDQLLMVWIGKAGRDMFNLQTDAREIADGIAGDLDMDLRKIGISVTDFNIESFSYPEEIRKMQEKVAAQSMIGDTARYQQIATVSAMENGSFGGRNSTAADMVGLQMGMALGQQMVNQMQGQMQPQVQNVGAARPGGAYPKFCPNCGTATEGKNFCGNCGEKLVQ